MVAGMATAAPKSIFDDDWVPPKPTAKPAADPAPVTPKPPTPDPVPKPPDPTVKPPTATPTPVPVAVAPAARLPIPERDKQVAVRKVMREVFAEQLADASPAARRKLADNLLAQAGKAADAPVDRFVLLAAAVDAGLEGGSLPLAFKAADDLGGAFEVDPLAVKAEKVNKLNAKAGADAVSTAANVSAGLALAGRLVAEDDYVAAGKVLTSVQTLTAADPKLRAQVQQQIRDLGAARQAREQIAKSEEKLKADPADPAANAAVGSYLCFHKRDWSAGLPMLLKGSDAKLKRVAEQELQKPETPDGQVAIADGWWDASAAAAGPQKAAMQAHAAEWYERAAPGLKSLTKARVEKRLEQARLTAVAGGETGTRTVPRAGGDIIVEALIDGDSTLHLTPDGIYWAHHGTGVKPGRFQDRHEPTYVNGVAWQPKWKNPGPGGYGEKDQSDVYPLRVGADLKFDYELVACGQRPGGKTVETRTPVQLRPTEGEYVIYIRDADQGAAWYRFRIFHKP
jgi:hypothetical protein